MEQQPSTLKENRPYGTKSFPYAIYRTHSAGKGTMVQHHWHDEEEILYFSNGKFRLEINLESFSIQSECLYFINPGELHSIITETADGHWEDAVVFSPGILSFDSYDEAQIHLIRPIQNGRLLFPRSITPQHPAFSPIRDAFMDIMHSFGQMAPEDASDTDSTLITNDLTSQLYIKSSLLYILATLSDHRLFIPTEKNLDKRVECIKTALTYIRDNYQDKIYISDLARQVNLNEQYFCRLFKKVIGQSPIEYLNEHQIKQTRRLLEETDLPVMEICLECGYNNLSNFLREFRKHTGATPKQYREKEAKQYAGENTHELNMVFQFEHVEGDGKYRKWTDEKMPLTTRKKTLSRWQTELYDKAWNSLFWDNHDQPRAVSRFGDDRPEYRAVSAKMLATCLHMLQGTPYIYQGEDPGMTNYPFKDPSEFRDIESINAYQEWCVDSSLSHDAFWPCLTFKSRDNIRTPVQWDDSAQAGFTTRTPCIAVNPNYKEINAKAETADPDSVFHYYKKLIVLRKQNPIMIYGKYEALMEDSKKLFVYTRAYQRKNCLWYAASATVKQHSLSLMNFWVHPVSSPIQDVDMMRKRSHWGLMRHLCCIRNNDSLIKRLESFWDFGAQNEI